MTIISRNKNDVSDYLSNTPIDNVKARDAFINWLFTIDITKNSYEEWLLLTCPKETRKRLASDAGVSKYRDEVNKAKINLRR